MSTAAIELPLYPLNLVLFPGTVMPLHVIEPEDCQMIEDCQLEDKPFGVVLAKPGSDYKHEGPYAIGTMAEIHNLNQLEDGCYDLMAVGIRRFRILSQHRGRTYLSAQVEFYDDVLEPAEELVEPMQRVRHLFETYLNMVLEAVDEQELETNLPALPEDLSHFIAHFLEIEDVHKQRCLEFTSTQQRLYEEIAILRREIPFLRQILSNKLPDDRVLLN